MSIISLRLWCSCWHMCNGESGYNSISLGIDFLRSGAFQCQGILRDAHNRTGTLSSFHYSSSGNCDTRCLLATPSDWIRCLSRDRRCQMSSGGGCSTSSSSICRNMSRSLVPQRHTNRCHQPSRPNTRTSLRSFSPTLGTLIGGSRTHLTGR